MRHFHSTEVEKQRGSKSRQTDQAKKKKKERNKEKRKMVQIHKIRSSKKIYIYSGIKDDFLCDTKPLNNKKIFCKSLTNLLEKIYLPEFLFTPKELKNLNGLL